MNSRLKILRKSLGLNQSDFSAKIGLTSTSISKIEGGVNKLTEQNIKSICREFNVNEDWLRNGNGEMFNSQNRKSDIENLTKTLLNKETDSFKNRLISALANLSEEQWELLVDIAEEITEKNKDISKKETAKTNNSLEIINNKNTQNNESENYDNDLDIEAELESYRRELEAEKNTRMYTASQDTKKA